MNLPLTAEYALRAMAALALMPVGVRARNAELSRATAVPISYLSKVMRQMVVAGLVTAEKGHGGGFMLARPPGEISFNAILDATGIERDRPCAFGWGKCNAERPCPLHDAWSELKDRWDSWAEGTTLADVTRQESPLSHLGPRRRSARAR